MDKCSFHGQLAELSTALSGLPRLAHLQPQDQATFSPSEAQAHAAGTDSSRGQGRGQGLPPRRTV